MTAFLGQIDIFATNAVPAGWLKCEGQQLPINQNQALFSLLGINFGGDGQRTFALPDLRGRVPIGIGQTHVIGEFGGQETHVLTTQELPSHTHALMADATARDGVPTPSPATVLGRSAGRVAPGGTTFSVDLYAAAASEVPLNAATIAPAGNNAAHENRMPSLALSYCICVDPHATYPTRD